MGIWVFAIVLVGLLLCMFLIDTVQVLLRAISTMVSAPVLGAHLGSIFMLANRAATALALVLVGYLVDIFVPKQDLLITYSAAALVIAMCHLPLTKRLPLLRITLFSFRRIYGKSASDEQVNAAIALLGRKAPWRVSVAVMVVTTIGFLGLLAPSLLASTFPTYRATLMQTGFILNSLASIISVLHVERIIAVTIDQGDPEAVNALYSSYIASRMLGYLTAFALFAATLLLGLWGNWFHG